MKLAATPAVSSVRGKSSAPRPVQSWRRVWCPRGEGLPGQEMLPACPPARLASCRPGPWASSGAPCPQPWTHLPLFLPRATLDFRSPSSSGGCGALGSPWGEEAGGRGPVPSLASRSRTALVVWPYALGMRCGVGWRAYPSSNSGHRPAGLAPGFEVLWLGLFGLGQVSPGSLCLPHGSTH